MERKPRRDDGRIVKGAENAGLVRAISLLFHERLGITDIAAMARAVPSISPATWTRLMKNLVSVNYDHMRAIASALGITAAELIARAEAETFTERRAVDRTEVAIANLSGEEDPIFAREANALHLNDDDPSAGKGSSGANPGQATAR